MVNRELLIPSAGILHVAGEFPNMIGHSRPRLS